MCYVWCDSLDFKSILSLQIMLLASGTQKVNNMNVFRDSVKNKIKINMFGIGVVGSIFMDCPLCRINY